MKQFAHKSWCSAMLALGMVSLGANAFAQSVKIQMRFDDAFTSDVGTAGAPFTATNFNGAGPFTFTNQVTIYQPNPVTFQNATIGGQAARAARFPAGSFFTLNHNIPANGGGTKVNKYTLIYDIQIDSLPNGYASLFQKDTNNSDDGDGFVRNSDKGVGISGDYTDDAGEYTPFANPLRFTLGAWQRVVVTIDANTAAGKASGYRTYINGKLQNIVIDPDGLGVDDRFALDPVIHILADEDGEQADVLINNFQMRDYTMSDAEIAALGAPTAAAIDPTIRLTSTVSGTVKLKGLDASSPTQTVLVTARDAQNNVLFYRVLDNAGATTPISLTGLLKGQTRLLFSSPKHLSKAVTVDTTGGNISNFAVELSGGEGTGDNVVDITDLLLLIAHYNNNPSYLAAVDFNGDGANDITDLLTIVASYNMIGSN